MLDSSYNLVIFGSNLPGIRKRNHNIKKLTDNFVSGCLTWGQIYLKSKIALINETP